jgi:hypothetical protein
MKFLLLIAYTDLSDDRARVHVEPFEADTEEAAKTYAEKIEDNGKMLMDLLVEDWEHDYPELKELKGMAILAEHGISVGDIEVWSGDKLVVFRPGLSPHARSKAA